MLKRSATLEGPPKATMSAVSLGLHAWSQSEAMELFIGHTAAIPPWSARIQLSSSLKEKK